MKKKIICIFILTIFLASSISASGFINGDILLEARQKHIQVDKPDFEGSINFLMKYGNIPAISTCIVEKNEVIWSDGFGYSDVENSIAATDETVFMIASITKTITGTALLQLFDLGYFELDDDVNFYLPFELRNPNFPEFPITYRMLLSHSSSLIDTDNYWDIDFYLEGPPFDGYPVPWLENYLTPNGSNYDPLIWSENYGPGEKSSYANINFDIIAYLVEIISDEPFYEYCENNIFEPLDMDKSSFRLTDYDNEEVAIPYFWNPYTKKHETSQNWVFIHYPAGGLFTTVLDLSHFLIAHMNGGVYNGSRILNEETVEEMHKIQSPGNKNSFYFGLAWLFMSRSIWIGFQYPLFFILHFKKVLYSGHGGDISYGLHTRMNMKITENVGVIYFINTHRLQRSGWQATELLNEVLFKKAKNLQTGNYNLQNFPRDKNQINFNLPFKLSASFEIQNTFFYNHFLPILK
jgi:CubicO group peptidase (beta-lactamase class C family)